MDSGLAFYPGKNSPGNGNIVTISDITLFGIDVRAEPCLVDPDK